jgi:hypothetical protein
MIFMVYAAVIRPCHSPQVFGKSLFANNIKSLECIVGDKYNSEVSEKQSCSHASHI